MWTSKMHAEKLFADVRALRGLVAQEGRRLDPDQKMAWKSAESELATLSTFESERAVSFQKRLQLAEKQGITLREFEKLLA